MRQITSIFVSAGLSAGLLGTLGGCRINRNSDWPPKYAAKQMIVLDAPAESVDVRATTGFGDLDVKPHGAPLKFRMSEADRMETVAAVESSDRRIQVVAIVRSDREERLSQVRVLPTLAGSVLSLDAEWPGARREKEGIDWFVRLPSIGSVSVATGFGDVVVTAPEGRVDAGTGFGDIAITDARGPLELQTGFGDLTVRNAHSAIRAMTDFGDVSLEEVHDAVYARSDHGDIDVVLEHTNTGPVDAETDFGDITIAVGRAFVGDIAMSTDFGDLNIDTRGAEVDLKTIEDDLMVVGFSVPTTTATPAEAHEHKPSRAVTDHGDVRVVRRAD